VWRSEFTFFRKKGKSAKNIQDWSFTQVRQRIAIRVCFTLGKQLFVKVADG